MCRQLTVAGQNRILDPLLIAARRIKTSTAISLAKARLGRVAMMLERREGLSADLSGRIGMGALICYALRLHDLAEQRGQTAHIVSTSPLYSAGGDVFGQFFDRAEPSPGWRPHGVLATEWLLHRAAPGSLALARAQDLMARYFRPKAALRAEIAGPFDLSIHFRGTDKFMETGRIDVQRMLDALAPHLPDQGAGRSVFLATDDAAFAVAVRATYALASFRSYDLGEVAPGVARHFSDLSARDKAMEALVNIYSIASAPLCVRTSSYLSAISRLANPDMATITINHGPGELGFPEQQIRAAEGAG